MRRHVECKVFMRRHVECIEGKELFLQACMYCQENKESPELLFALFAQRIQLHKEFNAYLQTHSFDMKRDKSQLQKRKLFIKWFYHHYSKKKRKLTTVSEAADLVFASARTVQSDLMSPFDLGQQEKKSPK